MLAQLQSLLVWSPAPSLLSKLAARVMATKFTVATAPRSARMEIRLTAAMAQHTAPTEIRRTAVMAPLTAAMAIKLIAAMATPIAAMEIQATAAVDAQPPVTATRVTHPALHVDWQSSGCAEGWLCRFSR